MKLAIVLGLFGALVQAGHAQKCIERLSSSAPEELSTSTTEIVYSAVPMPSEYSVPQSDTAVPSSTAPAMYSTIPMPSDFSKTYLDTSKVQEATTTAPAMYSTIPMPSDFSKTYLDTSEIQEATTATTVAEEATTSEVYAPASSSPPSSSSAQASPSASPSTGSSSAYYQITLDDLNKAVPDRAGADSCSAAKYASECATNSRAVTAINNALTKYKITRRGEAVAVIALMAFESDSWQYNINHSPETAGQGTRDMHNYTLISQYAKELHPEDTAKALGDGAVTDQVMNNVRALVLNDDDSFGSGFWYLVNHAPNYYNKSDKLHSGYPADFREYIVNDDGYGVGSRWVDSYFELWLTLNAYLPK